ncbi:hypothetical protein BC940DRAFT_300138 [Gongronella butleri]|nr:hypothetical protein BC940DRAFT_300138 [Gongronella butleri]
MNPPTRRLSTSQRNASRLRDGLSSSYKAPLDQLTKPQLLDLRERTAKMLDNTAVVSTLPDKGSRLQEKLAEIDALLKPPFKPGDTDKVTEEVSALSLNSSRRDMRQRSIDENTASANEMHMLLQAGSSANSHVHAKSKMISLSESMLLQEQLVKQENETALRKQMQHIKISPPDANDLR